MKKQDSKLALSVLAALTTTLALIYTLMMYRDMVYAVAGISLLFLLTAFILTKNLIAFSAMHNKSIQTIVKSGIDDISSQLEILGGAQTQLGKATYIYTKQTANVITRLEDNYAESQMALYKNLASLSSLQNKATGLIIKYNQNNTTKLVSSIKDMHSQLNETMNHGFDQIQPADSSDIIAILEDITTYLKSRPEGMDEALSEHLDTIAQELRDISDDIRQIEIPAPAIIQSPPAKEAGFVPEEIPITPSDTDMPVDSLTDADILMPDEASITPSDTDTPVDSLDDADIPMPDEALITPSDTDMPVDSLTDADILMPDEASITPSDADTPVDSLTDADISMPDEASITPSDTDTPVDSLGDADIPISDDSYIDTLTAELPDASEKTAAEAPVTEIQNTASDKSPDSTLSADEIAALFASADPAPKKPEKKAADKKKSEPAAPAPEDSNKQLSADEIAALFASAEPAPQKEEPAPAAVPEPAAPVSDDPNKKLSADEIAALFASL
ncbi:MAG: MSCRAMM family adhesin SdrC [Bacteroidales bacterium]|nr:MSCRAMM family adhesin SdrC [Clostridium sp.]MCM1204231.1 MSCRAMM family adhesin SdrC [Bacteroidales bacterium]